MWSPMASFILSLAGALLLAACNESRRSPTPSNPVPVRVIKAEYQSVPDVIQALVRYSLAVASCFHLSSTASFAMRGYTGRRGKPVRSWSRLMHATQKARKPARTL